MSRYILGISAFYHDSAAALLKDGKVVFAAQEERFAREKNFPGFPARAVRAALDWAEKREGKGPGLDGVEAVAFYDKPLLKFERLIETYYAYAPRGFSQFLSAAPVWVREKMLLKRTLRNELAKIDPAAGIKLLFPEHHLSHAASAFYPSPFGEAAVLTVDGAGEWATASICAGRGKDLTILKELRFPHSLGLLYSAFTAYAGFKVNSGEYKLMGLAPYGDPASSRTRSFIRRIKDTLVDLKDDGSLWLNQDYFDYTTGLKMTRDERWEELFGIPPRRPESGLDQEYCDMALAAQEVTGEALSRMAAHAVALTGSRDLCLAGGVALNCVANGRILKTGICDRIWIQPAAGDAGGALGAALAAWHIHSGAPRVAERPDGMSGALLGPDYTDGEAEAFARSAGAVYEKLGDDALCARTAGLLDSGAVVGWFQGRMEWGPRALGNRSILADARNPEMQRT
ncbi:MAG TPA: carbamoyltransferase N-terminal domain-containing protein, partial [Elusimicrobiales bacterium]|nr:carbamoyltransferase N-terminal domain-containing protein [Elusimicrobiales bacterium]